MIILYLLLCKHTVKQGSMPDTSLFVSCTTQPSDTLLGNHSLEYLSLAVDTRIHISFYSIHPTCTSCDSPVQLLPGPSILGVGGISTLHILGRGVVGWSWGVMDGSSNNYYYSLSCTGRMFESGDF